MMVESETKRFVGFRCDTAEELLREIQANAAGTELRYIILKGDDDADCITFEPKKSENFRALFYRNTK